MKENPREQNIETFMVQNWELTFLGRALSLLAGQRDVLV